MNEEIDIIEILKRVKEGKAPKRIEIEGVVYERNTDEFGDYIETMYVHDEGPRSAIKFWTDTTTVSTKIKILDKPIIKRFEVTGTVPLPHQFRDKINEIIDYINKNNKE